MFAERTSLEQYHRIAGYKFFAFTVLSFFTALCLGYLGFTIDQSDAGRPIAAIFGLIALGFTGFLFTLHNRQMLLAREVALECTGRVRTPSQHPQEGERPR